MSIRHPTPWTWEEHELSEGPACIVYDATGYRVGGLDYLDDETANNIVAGVNTLVPAPRRKSTPDAAALRAATRRAIEQWACVQYDPEGRGMWAAVERAIDAECQAAIQAAHADGGERNG